jgi:hypothetical protein
MWQEKRLIVVGEVDIDTVITQSIFYPNAAQSMVKVIVHQLLQVAHLAIVLQKVLLLVCPNPPIAIGVRNTLYHHPQQCLYFGFGKDARGAYLRPSEEV